MVLPSQREQVRSLISDTVTLLCKNSLTFGSNICVEGLLGITVDDEDVFLVNIYREEEKQAQDLQDQHSYAQPARKKRATLNGKDTIGNITLTKRNIKREDAGTGERDANVTVLTGNMENVAENTNTGPAILSRLDLAYPTILEDSNLDNTQQAPDAEGALTTDYPEWEVMQGGSRFKHPRLIERNRYVYGKDHKATKRGQRWRCVVRNKNTNCLASVLQSEGTFTRGPQQHTCLASDCELYATEARSRYKKKARTKKNDRICSASKNTRCQDIVIKTVDFDDNVELEDTVDLDNAQVVYMDYDEMADAMTITKREAVS